ncbi:unnamed protein product [Candidula unifasciata]|uniref:Centromere protein X n=1 Tax=Candidula unifasciata TaxID=100452 RepID=A0A8S3YMI6_9EUPU|nr:unnamed protein product [Candidula unifasciata]
MAQSGATFKNKTVSETLEQHFQDKKVTVKGTALELVAELLRIFTKEALSRAALQAKAEGDASVMTEHLEKILVQLLLDM